MSPATATAPVHTRIMYYFYLSMRARFHAKFCPPCISLQHIHRTAPHKRQRHTAHRPRRQLPHIHHPSQTPATASKPQPTTNNTTSQLPAQDTRQHALPLSFPRKYPPAACHTCASTWTAAGCGSIPTVRRHSKYSPCTSRRALAPSLQPLPFSTPPSPPLPPTPFQALPDRPPSTVHMPPRAATDRVALSTTQPSPHPRIPATDLGDLTGSRAAAR